MISKIYVWCALVSPGGFNRTGTDVMGYAMAEDGKVLASHYCSNDDFARLDMGLADVNNSKHQIYAAHYPAGYRLVWLDDPESDPGWQVAHNLEWTPPILCSRCGETLDRGEDCYSCAPCSREVRP
jgi:hypothetical protein